MSQRELSRMALLSIFIVFAIVYPVFAQDLLPHEGEVLSHRLTVCLEKADAVEIVRADAERGFAAAKWLFNEKEKCDVVDVVGPVAGKVVYTAAVLRDDKKKTMRVVEIVVKGSVVGYFMSTMPLAENNAENNT